MPNSRVNYLLICCMILSVMQACKSLPEKPNILLITTDYQAWEDIPSLTPELEMPALDRLTSEGVVFKNHYCTAPVCMPSRYTIVSGTYPHTHGAWDNTGKWLPESSPILMESLKREGYRTIGIGKMHFKPWDRMAGFDTRIIADCQGNWAGDTIKKDDYYYYLRQAGLTRFDYLKYQDSTDLFGVFEWPLHDTLDIDYYVGQQGVRYIAEGNLDSYPWFLWISFNGPHNPWDPPAGLMETYLEKDLPDARYLRDELSAKPYAHTLTRYNYTRKVVDTIDMNPDRREEYIHRIRAGHYGGLTMIDRQIGEILDRLEEDRLLENTIVIFTSDHGAHLGDHDQIHKGTHYERSAHVPFIVWWPKVLKSRAVESFTSHVDIFPTLIELAGGEMPPGLEGKSFAPVFKGKRGGSDRAVIEILGSTSVVTERYKMGLYRQFREGDLYDRAADPSELYNRFNDSSYASVIDELKTYLFSFDPTLRSDFESAPEPGLPAAWVEIESGEVISGPSAPYPGGAGAEISLAINSGLSPNIPLISWRFGPNGFTLQYSAGTILLEIMKWGSVESFEIGRIGTGLHRLRLRLGLDGVVDFEIDGIAAGSVQTTWPPPRQPGRNEYISGRMVAGRDLIDQGTGYSPVENYPEGLIKGAVRFEITGQGDHYQETTIPEQ